MNTSKATSRKIDTVLERTAQRYAGISTFEIACRLIYRYEKKLLALRRMLKEHPKRQTRMRSCLNMLWQAAYYMDQTMRETPASIEYYDNVIASRLHVREPVVARLLLIASSGLQRLEFVRLMLARDAVDLADVVRNLPKVEVVRTEPDLAENIPPVLREFHEAYRQAINTGNERAFVELLRQLLASCIAYMPDDDSRFIPLFRSLVPCCWCGAEAPINSYGWDLRPANIRGRYIKLPCCPQCMHTIDMPKEHIVLDGLFSYTLALEQYVQRIDVTALQRVILDAVER